MKKIAFIIPYFGKFNNYFQLFLESCRFNPNIDWIIFTDDNSRYDFPDNVYVNYWTFNDIQNYIQNKFDFEIALTKPYKLCDFKVTYGFIFDQFLEEYDFWGHCDTDLIWGNILDFITPAMLEEYDKIGIYGHCTIYRNVPEINKMFMKSFQGKSLYKKYFSEPWNHSFDEEYKDSINNIFEEYGKKVYSNLKIANIYMKSSVFRLTYLNEKKEYEVEPRRRAIFVWNNGKLTRYEIKDKDGQLIENEYLYIHMQSRLMKVNVGNSFEEFKIVPNSFDTIEVGDICEDNFGKIKIKHLNLHYFQLRLKNLKTKIKRMTKGQNANNGSPKDIK